MTVNAGTSIGGKHYEIRALVLLALGFGLVGIDRFLISTLFPVIAEDLGLDYADIGVITGALAIAWGIAALIMGNLADRIGHRKVLTGALILFSLLIGMSGLAIGLVSLVLVRVMMGFADGAYTPASISATIEASPVERHGRNIGIQQMTLTLFGLGFSPIIVAALLSVVDWRLVFSIFVVPGLILAYLTWRTIPDPPKKSPGMKAQRSFADWRTVLSYANVRKLMVLMLCWLICLVTTSAFMPSYLLDHLHLEFNQMVQVMSAIGFGAAAGTLILPWLSDQIGRKPVMLISTIGVAITLILLNLQGASIGPLFMCLFFVHFFNNALITLTVGPICAESVPATLMATASGVVIAAGELFGGGFAPVIVGRVADHFGIDYILWLPIAAMIVALVVCIKLQETRPQIVTISAN